MEPCCSSDGSGEIAARLPGELVVALAGQPNMGKSTIFNALTGLNQHVGNWPGKTVEKKDGRFSFNGQNFLLVDLPGTYSLTANSPEEVITREYILTARPDLVIAVVNAANLERSLYLLAELVSLPGRLVIALNMMDVAAQENVLVDPIALEKALNIPVISMVATQSKSIQSLTAKALEVSFRRNIDEPNHPHLPVKVERAVREISAILDGYLPKGYPVGWVELKLLEGDGELTRLMKDTLPAERWDKLEQILVRNEDALLAIVSSRYEWIAGVIRSAVNYQKTGQLGLTEKLDRYAAHPVYGLFILAAVLGFIFWLTFAIGAPVQNWMNNELIHPMVSVADNALAPASPWIRGLVVDGILGGVGSVLTFLPILAIFFASFGLLEDIGYMARAAYVMDNLMHLMGLHGKSFLPLFLGFGCNVPAVLGTRVIDSREARLLTILVAPLVPCTARMAVVAFLAPAFFGVKATLVSWGLVFGSMLLLVLVGVLLNRTVFSGRHTAFIMEMPLYHLPNPRTIGLLVWQRSISFVKKAGTTILGVSVLVWVLSYLPGGDIQTSYLAKLGQVLEPAGRWMGLDWRLTLALLTSFLAKENSVATLGVLFGSSQSASLGSMLAASYSPATALAYLTVSTLFIPCAATVAVIHQETGSWKWTALNLGMHLTVSVLAGAAVFHIAASLMG
jgi:ferrous iron transport protein B